MAAIAMMTGTAVKETGAGAMIGTTVGTTVGTTIAATTGGREQKP